MRPLIRTARCWLLRARVRAMATLPMASPAAAIPSSATRPVASPSSRSHRPLTRFFSVAPAPVGAKGLRAAASAVEVGGVKIAREDVVKEDDPTNNVPDTIFAKIGLQLHRRENHPLGILKNTIYDYFDKNFTGQFDKFDDLCPLVSVKQIRTSSGTMINYRKMSSAGAVEMRWVDTYFPFTNPSFELEIYFQDDWLEVLGCGVTEQEILKRNGRRDHVAWAFGLGLERLAMVLFDIPDIRLFWSNDKRFTSQFSEGKLGVKFKPFSKFPPCYKDMSFWINGAFTENNLCEVVRGIAGDLVEEVKLIDNFTNKKGMTSHCYRIAYRSMERSLTDEEINNLQLNVREAVKDKLKVELR
ncbi:Phenylalanine--tRNA ligase chloroplastic/mitochondrial [Zea mays]|uniref:phenylalanine--tRNA ligase n=1 Tax=Zea mays TaxID=4577 RepID=A0A1D6ND63_MAIZE|nr:Phenylalanine--tRNA ligase chloroplastic/mitochondrial [Zea mays]